MPFGSPNPPVCTLLTGALTVAGAALPEFMLFSFTSSLGRLGPLSLVSIFASSNLVVMSGSLVSTFSTLGCTILGARFVKMCGCCGFSLGGSTTTGFTSAFGAALIFGAGGGGGGGATGISVTGWAISMKPYFTAVFIFSG